MEPPAAGKQRFHLVLAHGIGDDHSRRQKARDFWSSRFREALVTSFPFVGRDTISFGSLGFVGRAQALLEKVIEADRDAGAVLDSSSKPVQLSSYIFLGHDLGCSLVQQALVLAAQHKRYNHIADYTAALVFCERPSGIHVDDVTRREDEILRLSSGRHPDSRLPFGVLRELPCDLDEIAWAFEGTKRYYVYLDVTSQQGETTLRAGEEISFQRRVTLSSADLGMSLWQAEPNYVITEKIFDFIKQIIKKESRDISKRFHNFLSLLSSVSTCDPRLRLSRPFPGSLEWVAQHPSYVDWRREDGNAPDILYLSGPRGSGSSVIASHLVAELQKVASATVLTFSFDKLDVRTQSFSALYISFIRQLLFTRPPLFRLVSSVAEWVKDEDVFGYEVLTRLFLTLLKGSHPNSVFCVVHASEDCKGYNFDDMVTVLRRYRAMSSGIFKLAVLDESSPTGLFQNEGAKLREIDLSDAKLHAPGVQSFVKDRIGKLAVRRPEWEGYKQVVIDKMCNDAGSGDDGSASFLKASCTARLIEMAKIPSTARGVKTVAENLPSAMDDVYEMALRQSSVRIPLMPLLAWVWYSARPLTRRELAVVAALSTTTDTGLTWGHLELNTPQRIAQDIRPLKGALLRLSGMQVHPIHSTLGAFLTKKWREAREDAEVAVFSQCLDYLELALQNITDLEGAKDDLTTDALPLRDTSSREFSLLPYVVAHWHIHYARVRSRLAGENKDRILKLLAPARNCLLLFQLHQAYAGKQSERFPAFDTPLKIASRFGLADVVRRVLPAMETAGANAYKDALGDALDLAAGYDHGDVVELLLGQGAPCKNALCLAAKNGSAAKGGSAVIVATILARHPDAVNKKDDAGRTPFFLAAINGNETIAAYLLSQGAIGDVMAPYGRTAVHVAAKTGQSKVLGLVNGNIDIQAVDQFGNDALLMAAESGFDEVVEILLKRGVATGRPNQDGFTALHRAVALGHASTCELLIAAARVDILAESKTGFSPVHLAAQEGHLEILQRLIGILGEEGVREGQKGVGVGLRNGGDVEESTDVSGVARPPLELAALRGHVGVVRELLRYPRYSGEHSRNTALLLAAAQGWDGVVAEVMRSGVTAVVHDERGENALHLAAKFQHAHIITQILDSELNVNRKGLFSVDSETDNDLGRTSLHIAAGVGRLLTVRELLRRSANPRHAARDGSTAFHVAAGSAHLSVTEELLRELGTEREDTWRRGSDPLLLADVKGFTPLTRAVQGGHVDVAKAILQFARETLGAGQGRWRAVGAKLSDLQGEKDALCLAVEAQSEELVGLLTENGWDVNANNGSSPNGLHLAAGASLPWRDCSMLQLLLSKGADPNVKLPYRDGTTAQNQGDRPLHIAIEARRLDAVRVLLANQADVNAANDQGITPLWRATYDGWADGVRELLGKNPRLEARKTDSGWTALHAAYDDAAITKMLLEFGADPLALTKDGRPPFFLTADEDGCADTLRVYLDAGVDPNWRHHNTGGTVLHLAAVEGTVPTLELLVQRGADVNAANKLGSTPVHAALAFGPLDNLRFLLNQRVSSVDYSADSTLLGTLLMAAARRSDGPAAVHLLLQRQDINATSQRCDAFSALHTAAYSGHEDTVVELLSAGADPNLVGGRAFGSPLLAAVMSSPRSRRVRVATLLLDARADANYAGSTNGTALEWALSHNKSEVVTLLLTSHRADDADPLPASPHPGAAAETTVPSAPQTKYKINVNAISLNPRLGTPLLAAVDAGSLAHIASLLGLGADPNLPRVAYEAETPAQVAVRRGRLHVLKALVDAGADLGYVGPLGRRVLSHAIGWKSNGVLPYLWEYAGRGGAVDVNERDVEQQTPLMIAAREGSVSVVKELVCERAADVDARDRMGMTAVVHAARKDYGAIVDLLVSSGKADLRVADEKGRDALYWAARCAGPEAFRMVLDNIRGEVGVYEEAMFAAIGAARYDFFVELLARVRYISPRRDRDGWTVPFTAYMYRRQSWEMVIENAMTQQLDAAPKLPSRWDQNSSVCAATIGYEGKTLTVGELGDFSMAMASNSAELQRSIRGIVRADHPMVPRSDGVYYFEVTLEWAIGSGGVGVGVGLCEEHAETDDMLGRKDAALGYHGNDGRLFGGDNRTESGDPYGPIFGAGDTVGCGVNFSKGTVFYTKNGSVIGRAFTNIDGKLYPAVSMDLRMEGLKITAKFWHENDSLDGFRFQASLTGPNTLEETAEAKEGAKKAAEAKEAREREMRETAVWGTLSISTSDNDDSASYSSEDGGSSK